jgi:PASTA domain
MSFATTTFQFPIAFGSPQDPIRFTPTRGQATVGLNAQNLIRLGAVPRGRTWVPQGPDFGVGITLEPLNQPPVGNRGALVASIPPTATQPPRPSQSTYLVEFRRKAGWDQAIPQDTVLVHEVRTTGISYLQPTVGGQFGPGQQFVTPDPKVFVRVMSIDATTMTATLWIWDLPEGSLRRESSKPKVYLIEHGTKRWVTSPAALTALGKSFADVRIVPDGQLGLLPDGPDVSAATVPDVTGMTRANAASAIEAAGLVSAFVGAADPGAWVWSQSPSGGAIVVSGSTVTVQVQDSPPATVPDVTEMLKAKAESAIRAAGLVPAFTGLSGSGAWVSSQ